jgi:hypothetical protein
MTLPVPDPKDNPEGYERLQKALKDSFDEDQSKLETCLNILFKLGVVWGVMLLCGCCILGYWLAVYKWGFQFPPGW